MCLCNYCNYSFCNNTYFFLFVFSVFMLVLCPTFCLFPIFFNLVPHVTLSVLLCVVLFTALSSEQLKKQVSLLSRVN